MYERSFSTYFLIDDSRKESRVIQRLKKERFEEYNLPLFSFFFFEMSMSYNVRVLVGNALKQKKGYIMYFDGK